MPIRITQSRSIPGFRESTNSLLCHTRNYFELRELAGQDISMVDRTGDSVDHREISAIGKNLEANIMLELSSAEALLETLVTTENILKGTLHPGTAAAANPAPLTSVAGSIITASKALDRMQLDDPAGVQARETDRKGMIAEIQQYVSELTQTISDLEGLGQSMVASKFVGFPDCKAWSNAVATATDFLIRKYKDKDVYHVPASKLIGA